MVSHFYRTFDTNASLSAAAKPMPMFVDKYHVPSIEALIGKLRGLDPDVSNTEEVLVRYGGEELGYFHDRDRWGFIKDRYKRRGGVCIGEWADRVHSGAITLNDIYRNYEVNDHILGVPLFDIWKASREVKFNPIGYALLGVPMEQWSFWSQREETSEHPYYITRYNGILAAQGLDSLTPFEYNALYAAALQFREVTDQGGGAQYWVGRSEAQGKLPMKLVATYAARAEALMSNHQLHRRDIKDYALMICDDWSVAAIARFHEVDADHPTVYRLYNSGIKDGKLIAEVIAGGIPEEWARAGFQA